MKVLFDQNVPRALAKNFAEHEVVRSAEKGWQELRNGELLLAAEEEGFHLLLTCDRNLEYQQRVTGRKIATVALSTNNWPLIRLHIEKIARAVDSAEPGTFLSVDCGVFRRQRRVTGE